MGDVWGECMGDVWGECRSECVSGNERERVWKMVCA